jgi:1-phosphofructokinase family hexose kinase
MAAHALGAQAVWVGFLGGAVGEECAVQLRKLGIDVISVPTKAATRLNFELIEDSGCVTEVLEPGGTPDPGERDHMLHILGQGLRQKWKGAFAVMSGSLPQDMPASFYASLIALARTSGAKVYLDTSGEALEAGLEARPDFVKCNREEAESILGRSLHDAQSASLGARMLVERGARSAAITLGSKGLVWLESKEGPAWAACAPEVRAISTVGCGDATLGGFAFAAAQGKTGEEILRLATACGAANCVAEQPGQISTEVVQSLLPRIEIRRLAS